MQKPMSPGATLPFEFDWRPWLEGAAVASFSVTQEGSLTINTQSNASGLITTSVTLASTAREGGRSYIVCGVTTSDTPARTDSRRIEVVASKR
jgi:hypothetical protein